MQSQAQRETGLSLQSTFCFYLCCIDYWLSACPLMCSFVPVCPSFCLCVCVCERKWAFMCACCEQNKGRAQMVCCSVTSNISYRWFSVIQGWWAASLNRTFPQQAHTMCRNHWMLSVSPAARGLFLGNQLQFFYFIFFIFACPRLIQQLFVQLGPQSISLAWKYWMWFVLHLFKKKQLTSYNL